MWRDRRIAISVAVVVPATVALLCAPAMPRGPLTTTQAMVTMMPGLPTRRFRGIRSAVEMGDGPRAGGLRHRLGNAAGPDNRAGEGTGRASLSGGGRYEARGRAVPAREWFDLLRAPSKQWITFDNSGHRPLFEEPERFYEVMTGTVLAETS